MDKLNLVAIYERQELGLDSLSADLTNLFMTEASRRDIESVAWSIDIEQLCAFEAFMPLVLSEVIREASILVRQIEFKLSENNEMLQLIALHLERPNVLIQQLYFPKRQHHG